MAARLIKVFCRCACWDAAHQSQATAISSRLQNSPSTSRRPTRLASVLGDSPRAALRLFTLMLLMSASDPTGRLRAFIVEVLRGLLSRQGPLFWLRPPFSALWLPEAKSQSWMGSPSQSPLGCGPDDVDVEVTECRRTPLQRSFPLGCFSLPPLPLLPVSCT